MLEISPHQSLRQAREELDRLYLQHHLKTHGWQMKRIAEIVGMDRCHLYRLAHRLGIFNTGT